ncbi:MAG: transcription antitermination factor NusB [Planctomycetes bacterium]|nr:transcription antitermination factor NusB [Planctomycetota bacterium]
MTAPKTKVRTRAREAALSMLYARDTIGHTPQNAGEFIDAEIAKDVARAFARDVFFGVCDNIDFIDDNIILAADNWSLNRMPLVDRNIIRLGFFEIALLEAPTPHTVAINEAVEIAKKFGDQSSPTFVNGVLDKLAKLARSRKDDRDDRGYYSFTPEERKRIDDARSISERASSPTEAPAPSIRRNPPADTIRKNHTKHTADR